MRSYTKMGAFPRNPMVSPLTAMFLQIPRAVQEASLPPLILNFSPFDPTGSGHLPADAITCAALGCHPLGVITALHVQDTANTDAIQPVAPDLIDEQARLLLEDMRVQALRIGPLYTTESISVLAQIMADYADVPSILHLGPLPDDSVLEDAEPEDTCAALQELLLPQASLVLTDHALLAQWQDLGWLAGAGDPVTALLDQGPGWVLASGAPLRPGHSAYVLQGQDGQHAHWAWTPPPARLRAPDAPLSCALAAQLAMHQDDPDMSAIVAAALSQASALTARTFRPGMGATLIDRRPIA